MNHTEYGTIAVGAPNSAMRRITEHPEPKWPCTVGAENWPPVNYNVRTETPWGVAQTAMYFAKGLMRFDDDYGVIFTFDSNGLCDIEWFDGDTGLQITEPSGVDSAALCALSQDAQEFLRRLN